MVVAPLLQFHAAWAWVVIIGNAMAGVWSLGAIKIAGLRTRALWWFTILSQSSIFIQVATGIYLVAGEQKKPPVFHPFYGFVAIVASGFLFAYRDRMANRIYLLYGLGGLFLAGLGIRALLVALGG